MNTIITTVHRGTSESYWYYFDARGWLWQGDRQYVLDGLRDAKCRTTTPIPDEPPPGWWSPCEPIPQPEPVPPIVVWHDSDGWWRSHDSDWRVKLSWSGNPDEAPVVEWRDQ